MRPGRGERGFTLLELMVAVLVVGILLAVGVPTFLSARTRAQDRAAQADLRSLMTAAVARVDAGGSLAGADAGALAVETPLSLLPGTSGSTGPRSVSVNASSTAWTATARSASGACVWVTRSSTGLTGWGSTAASSGCAAADVIPPLPITGSGPLLWWDAADLDGDGINRGTNEPGLAGGNVTAWVDRGTVRADLGVAAGYNAPAFETGGLNGRPGVFFNGITSNSYLANTSSSFNVANDHTTFVVGTSTGAGEGVLQLGVPSTAAGVMVEWRAGSNLRLLNDHRSAAPAVTTSPRPPPALDPRSSPCAATADVP